MKRRTTEVYFRVLPGDDWFVAMVMPQSLGAFPIGTREFKYGCASASQAEEELHKRVRKVLSPDRVRFIEYGR